MILSEALKTPTSLIDYKNKNIPQISSKTLLQLIVNTCSDVRAKDILILDVAEQIGITDFFVIASARSDRQAQGIANKILDITKEAGITAVGVEGLDNGQWVAVDFGDIVVHVFYEMVRSHYDLEGLWSHAKRIPITERPSGVSIDLKAA